MSQQPALKVSDVQSLLADPSVSSRAEMAVKIAQSFGTGRLTVGEKAIAHDIFRMMMRDAEAKVRRALAESLKDNPDVPRDVALALAQDVESVAAPLLEWSTALTDADLESIVRSSADGKQSAVARRRGLSATLARAIAETAGPLGVQALMENATAAIPDDAFGTVLNRFGGESAIQTAMVNRNRLPVSVAERLVNMVSVALRERLMAEHDLPTDLATDLLLQARERATVDLALSVDREDLSMLVGRLRKNGRLTPTLILRSICAGDFDFLECALAELAGIPVNNAYRLMHDQGGQGLVGLIRHCGLSDDFLEIAQVALAVTGELQLDGQPGDRVRFAERMIERVLTSFEDRFDTENLNYLIGRLGRSTAVAEAASPAG